MSVPLQIENRGRKVAMGNRENRLSQILTQLQVVRAMTIKDLADHLEVTQMTIRRDLQKLEEQRLVRLFHGVAVSIDRAPGESFDDRDEYLIDREETQNTEAKRRIGKAAAELVRPDEVVYLDAGSTTESVIRNLDPKMPLTIISPALNIINLASVQERWHLVCPGGFFHKGPIVFEGDAAALFITQMRIQRAFISAAGVDARLGVTCTNYFEVRTKQAAINSSQERVLVADSSKFGEARMGHFADLPEFSTVVTDEQLADTYAQDMEEAGLAVHKA